MRLKVSINLKDKWIPFEYHGFLQGIIYRALDKNSGTFFHNQGFNSNNRIYRMFVFSELCGKFHIQNKGIVFDEEADFYISSISSDFMNQLYLYFYNNDYIMLGKVKAEIVNVMPVEDQVYNDNHEYILKTLSPIVCYKTDQKKYRTYFNPKSQDFEDSIRNNLLRKYNILYDKNNEYFEILQIIKTKEVKVKFKKCIYPANNLTMKVKVSDKYLKLLLHTGLGSKNASGFGMMKILK